MSCTRCAGTGWLNTDQLPDDVDGYDLEQVEAWIASMAEANEDHDVGPCDCCGDGEGWHGTPGEHCSSDYGQAGPYSDNGGLPECY